jgi:hypothetical protein
VFNKALEAARGEGRRGVQRRVGRRRRRQSRGPSTFKAWFRQGRQPSAQQSTPHHPSSHRARGEIALGDCSALCGAWTRPICLEQALCWPPSSARESDERGGAQSRPEWRRVRVTGGLARPTKRLSRHCADCGRHGIVATDASVQSIAGWTWWNRICVCWLWGPARWCCRLHVRCETVANGRRRIALGKA